MFIVNRTSAYYSTPDIASFQGLQKYQNHMVYTHLAMGCWLVVWELFGVDASFLLLAGGWSAVLPEEGGSLFPNASTDCFPLPLGADELPFIEWADVAVESFCWLKVGGLPLVVLLGASFSSNWWPPVIRQRSMWLFIVSKRICLPHTGHGAEFADAIVTTCQADWRDGLTKFWGFPR